MEQHRFFSLLESVRMQAYHEIIIQILQHRHINNSMAMFDNCNECVRHLVLKNFDKEAHQTTSLADGYNNFN